jgi:uncharacterized protein YhfF
MKRTPATDAYWQTFRSACGVETHNYDVAFMGDSPQMADELANLIGEGPKRATACLLRDITVRGDPMPVVGGHVVVVDGRGRPRCIWRTTEVTVKRFIEVDEAFAWDEGEGDRTRDDWLELHRCYFERQAVREGFPFDDEAATVFERFALVWPLSQIPA